MRGHQAPRGEDVTYFVLVFLTIFALCFGLPALVVWFFS